MKTFFGNTDETSTDVPIAYLDDGDAAFVIEGDAVLGQKLVVKQTVNDPDGDSNGNFVHTWQASNNARSWSDIKTGNELTLDEDLKGKQIRVRTAYVDDQGFSERIATETVLFADPDISVPTFGEKFLTTRPIRIGHNHVRPGERISGVLTTDGFLSTNPSNSKGLFSTAKLESGSLYIRGSEKYGGNGIDAFSQVMSDVAEVHVVAERGFVALSNEGDLKTFVRGTGAEYQNIKSIATSASGFIALDKDGNIYGSGSYQDLPSGNFKGAEIFAGGYGGYGLIDANGDFKVWGYGSEIRNESNYDSTRITDTFDSRAVGIGFEYGKIGIVFEDGSAFNIPLSEYEGINTPPVLNGTPVVLSDGIEDVAYTLKASDLLQGYSDADGDALSVSRLTTSVGSLTNNGNSTWTLDTPKDFNGKVDLSYSVIDGNGGSVDAAQSFSIAAVNDASILRGTENDDLLNGKETNETIYGLGGNDTIDAKAGNDSVYGGDGNDVIDGSYGNDELYGDAGNDSITDTRGSNALYGGAGNDSLNAQSLTEAQNLWGGSDNDSLRAAGTQTFLNGEDGDDNLFVYGWVYQNGLDDPYVEINRAETYQYGGRGKDSLGAQSIFKADLHGGDGDDNIRANAVGITNITGGEGNDNVNVRISYHYNLRPQIDRSKDFISTVVDGGTGNDTINIYGDYSYTEQDTDLIDVKGGDGEDEIKVEGSNYNGGDSSPFKNVLVDAGSGNDSVNVSGAKVSVTLGTGQDTLHLTRVHYNTLIEGGAESEALRVKDFKTGNGGDLINAGRLLEDLAEDYDGTNPFKTGHLVAYQAGNNTHIAFDKDGRSGSSEAALTVAILENANDYLLDANNFWDSYTPVTPGLGSIEIIKSIELDSQKIKRGQHIIATAELNKSPDFTWASVGFSHEDGGDYLQLVFRNESTEGNYVTSSKTGSTLVRDFMKDGNYSPYVFTIKRGDGSYQHVATYSDGWEAYLREYGLNNLSFTVTPNNAPILSGTPVVLANGTEDVAYTLKVSDLLQGYSDADGDALSVSRLTASVGSLNDNGNSTWTLNTPKDFNGNVDLSYSVIDTNGGSVDASNSFQVDAVNDAPVVTGPVDLGAIDEDTSILITKEQLLKNSSDVDGDELSAVGLELSKGEGELASNSDGSWTYSPTKDWNGSVSFSYSVSDGNDDDIKIPQDAVKFQDSYYTLVEGPTFLEAEARAQSLGGDLVSINSAEENKFLRDSFDFFNPDTVPTDYQSADSAQSFWVGLEYLNQAWTWADSTTPESNGYSNWIPGDPDYLSREIYAKISPDATGRWANATNNDVTFSEKPNVFYGIAEIKVGADFAVETSANLLVNPVDDDPVIIGTRGNDLLIGKETNDFIYGRRGNDELLGKEGNDDLFGEEGDDRAYGGYQNDNIDGGSGNDRLYGEQGDDLLEGGIGNDDLYGGDDDDILYGGDGNDRLTGGEGADYLDGGNGSDIYVVDDERDTIIDSGTDLSFDTIIYRYAAASYQLTSGIEKAVLQTGDFNTNVRFSGNDQSNDITTGDSNDIVNAGAGDDIIYTASGNDKVEAGAGNDLIIGGDGAGDDSYDGGSGIDTVKYTSATDDITVDLSQGTAISTNGGDAAGIGSDTLSNIENIIGGNYNDQLIGDAADNTFSGEQGNDVIDGGKGADVLDGGSGNDTYFVDNANDKVIETAYNGSDTVNSSVSFHLRHHNQHLENLNLTGSVNSTGVGNGLSNTIQGNSGNNILNGAWGDDILYGGAGNDVFKDDNGADVMHGGSGDDTFYGGQGNDLLDGGADIDTAIFKGNLDEYQISRNGKTKHLIIEDKNQSRDGTDNVANIENFSFNDSEVSYFDLITAAADEFAEYGSVSVNHTWQEIELSLDYINPVVITSDPTFKGGDPAVVRLQNIDSDSFQIRLQEPNYKDGRHTKETVSYVVMEEGTWELSDGTTIEAGVLNTNKLSTQGRETVALDDAFGSDASVAVLTQTQTFNGPDWVTTRTDNITGESFQVMMQEEEKLNSGGHVTESIGFLAIEQGSASDGDTIIEGGVTADKFTHQATSHSFETEFDSAPTLLTKLDSFDGPDTANSRIQSVDADGFTAMVIEEQSLDSEMLHTTESLSYLALDGDSGILSGIAVI